VPPCRVTNTSDEIYRAKGLPTTYDEKAQTVELSMLEVHNPELGRLENRVGKFYLQELFEDSGIDLEETAYWFHTPPGGWSTEPVKLQAAEEAPVTFPEPWHEEGESTGRVEFERLREGEVITGVISDCWLYHGIQVDFGAACDGLVPIFHDQWMEEGVRETLMPGEQVRARIHKLRRPGLYRWPVQLELLEPAHLAHKLLPPDAYDAPIDHGWAHAQGWTMQDICAATGRFYEGVQYFLREPDADIGMELQVAYGWEDEQANYDTDPNAIWHNKELLKDKQPEINRIAADLMLGQDKL